MTEAATLPLEELDAYVDALRRSFPFYRDAETREISYLNNAATALRPDPVYEAVGSTRLNPLTVGKYLSGARRTIAGYFGVPGENLYALMGSHLAFERLFHLLSRRGRQHVLLTDLEHKAVTNPLDHLEAKGELSRAYLLLDAIGCVEPETVKGALTPEVTSVVVTHVSNATGTIQPISGIARAIREYNQDNGAGVLLIVDGPQAVPRFRVDPSEADVYVFAQQKSFSLAGCILYLSDRAKRTISGASELEEADLFVDEFLLAGTEHAEAVLSFGAALEFVRDLPPLPSTGAAGIEAAATIVDALEHEAVARLSNIPGVELLGIDGGRLDENAGILLLIQEGRSVRELGDELAQRSVVVRSGTLDRFGHYFCVPRVTNFLPRIGEAGGAVRVSLSFYNDTEDLDRLCRSLT